MPFHIYFEIAAFVAGIIAGKHIRASYLKWFVPYLLLIVIVEIAGWYFPEKKATDVSWIFNISVPIEYLFFSYIFYKAASIGWFRKIIRAVALVFTGYAAWYSVTHPITQFNARYLLIGSFMMIAWSIGYFYDLYRKPDMQPVSREPMLWITLGVFLFNAGEFSYDLVSGYIVQNNLDPGIQIFRSINRKLNILFYILISVGLLCPVILKPYRKN